MAVDSRFTEDERKAINTVLLTLEAERANRGCTFPVPAIATVRAMLESPDPSRRAAVDVDAVMALVREYAIACKAIADGSDYAVGEARNYRAAIRALLEPHDAARLRETIAKAIWDADRGYATSIPWPPVSEFREGQAYRIADAVIRAIGGAQ